MIRIIFNSFIISDYNRTAFDVAKFPNNITGLPDGMTIDTDDNLWIALYGGGSVIKVNPKTGELLQVKQQLSKLFFF